ncbi:MAG: hypothetical protein F4Y02_14270 [Chloroflexi bacterium]|nr:hypothetical protein [Chloroflexota bacterium]
MKTRYPILGLVAFALIVAVAGEARASCTGSNRVSRDNSECLHGWWNNRSWPNNSTFAAQNTCPGWGRVVAKIDIQNASDRTWYLGDSTVRRGDTSSRVRDIWCCKDLADRMCNKADRVTSDSCKSQFEESNADDDCDLDGDPTTDETQCKFKLSCTFTDTDGEDHSYTTSDYSVTWTLVDSLEFCVDTAAAQPRMWMSLYNC